MNLFLKGVEEFNSKDFFSCHDSWEELWLDTTGPSKLFYQGLIQIAVGYYHATCGNYRGAEHLFSKALVKLREFLPGEQHIPLSDLIPQFEAHHSMFRACLETNTEPFDPALAPLLHLDIHTPKHI